MSFDADTFMNTAIDGALDTTVVPVPEGEYEAAIEDVKVRQFESKKIDENTGQLRQITAMDVFWVLRDDRVARELGRDKVTVKQGVFLDITPEGQLDHAKGKNIGLGRLRDALGQNDPNRPWNPAMLKGAGPAMIHVTQRPGQNEGEIFNDVKKVSGL